MANTLIQLKSSTSNATPSILDVAEPAYSYVSNTLFIGTADGTGVLAIGGQSYVAQQQTIYNTVNAAFTAANTGTSANSASSYANSAFAVANSAAIYANAAFLAANSASDTWVRNQANAAFLQANTPSYTANSAASYANSSFEVANSAAIYANAAFAAANSASDTWVRNQANAAFLQANTPSYVANSAASYANAAFIAANTKFNTSGGTITGDTNITGNLTVTGTTTYANTQTVLIADNILTLNAAIGQSGQPVVNAGIEVDRGAQPNAQFLWVETAGKWSANNGNGSIYIAADSAESYANAAFAAANAATATDATQNNSITASFNTANAAFLQANTPSHVSNSAASYANSAFARANNSLNANTGGTVAGDVTITSNLTTGTLTTNTITSGVGTGGVIAGANVVYSNVFVANSGGYIQFSDGSKQYTANAGSGTDPSAGNYANAAFLQANTPSYVANSAATYANGAFAAANAATATDTTQNNSITAAFAHANAAFIAANTAGGSVQGNTVTLGSNTVGQLVSNAVTLTTATTVTNGLSLINNVLGKLVPPGPPAFPSSNTIAIASVTSYRMTNFTQTDRTPSSRGVSGGTTVTNARRAATYSITPTIPDQGPGDSGTLSLYVNGANTVAYTLTSSSANGTYTSGGHSLVISDSVDYGSKIVGTAQGFWRSFDCSANGTVSNGWNELYITHSGASTTNTPFWYYDDSAPGAVVVNNGSLTVNTAAYSNSSTVLHYTSSTLFNLGFNISKLSGDMYPTSDTFVASAAGGAFGANSGVTYAQAGITTPLARNLYVSSGQATVNLTSAIISGFGSSATGVVVTGQNSYTAGTLSVTPGVTILYKTGNTSSNTLIAGEDNLFFGSTVGTGSTAAYRIVNPGSTDTPAYANGASAFNSTSGTLQTYDATLVAATLKHDQVNYSTGYLPVGPNLSSGRSGPQYFTFKFVRTSLSKFDIQFTGNTAGVWVAAPGTVIDSTSSLNGWLSMTTAYAGSGIPGANAPGNGSNGCALGGTITANTAVTTHRKTCTFGTVSTSNSTGNEVYVRIKLLAGQTITALSLQTANN